MTDKDILIDELYDEVNYNMELLTEGWEYYINRGISREEYAHTLILLVKEYLNYWSREFEDIDEE